MNRLALLRMALLAAAVSVAATACGDDDDSDDGRTGGAAGKGGSAGSGGKGGSGGSTSSGGEGGDATGSGGKGGSAGSSGGEGGTPPSSGGAGGEGVGGGENEGGTGGQGNDCSVEADFGDLGELEGDALGSTSWGSAVSWYAPLGEGTVTDVLWIELYNGYGQFAEGIETVTNLELTGDETDYDTCSLCILITDAFPVNDPSSAQWGDDYMLRSGTITLTSVEGNITGTLTDAVFAKVESFTSNAPAQDGCEVTIDSLEFDAAIQAP